MAKPRSTAPAIGIRELRDRLSATMRRVRAGQAVTITDRSRPVAVIVPLRHAKPEALLRTLVQSGRVSWSGGKPTGSPRPARVRGAAVSAAVLEDRR